LPLLLGDTGFVGECVFGLSFLVAAVDDDDDDDDCFCSGFEVQGLLLSLLIAAVVLLLLPAEVVHGDVTFLATAGSMDMDMERGTDGCCFCGDDTVDDAFSTAGAAGLSVLAVALAVTFGVAVAAPDTPVADTPLVVLVDTPVDVADAA
jgi:hypothetical protein